MRRYYIRPRGHFYALGPIKAAAVRAARKWAREYMGTNRFYGEVWLA